MICRDISVDLTSMACGLEPALLLRCGCFLRRRAIGGGSQPERTRMGDPGSRQAFRLVVGGWGMCIQKSLPKRPSERRVRFGRFAISTFGTRSREGRLRGVRLRGNGRVSIAFFRARVRPHVILRDSGRHGQVGRRGRGRIDAGRGDGDVRFVRVEVGRKVTPALGTQAIGRG